MTRIVSPRALGRTLRRTPVTPTSVATLLGGHTGAVAFRRIVAEIFPAGAAAILAAHEPFASREQSRMWAFLHRVEAELFPVYDLEEYDQVAWGIPFVREGWSYDRLHDLDLSPGRLLLFSLCAQPVDTGMDSRVALLDAAETYVPRPLLLAIPPSGVEPAALHERLDGTTYAAAAEFADWLWGQTGTAFLDLDDEVEVGDADWTRAIVDELARQWQTATTILDHIDALGSWLQTDPPAHFARLLDAALGRDPHLHHQPEGRQDAHAITETRHIPVPHCPDGNPNPVAVPPGAPR